MNKKLIAERFARAIRTYECEALVQRRIACKMDRLIAIYADIFCQNIFEIGCGTGFLSRLLYSRFHPCHLILNDLCEQMRNCLKDLLEDKVTFLPGDAEICPFPTDQQLLASCSTLQWLSSPVDFFEKCFRSLATGGYLAFSTFGPENLKEINSITGVSLSYFSLEELKNMLVKTCYEVIYFEEEKLISEFDSPLEVLYHLKHTGVTATGNKAIWTKYRLQEFEINYRKRFTIKNKVYLTYHPLYFIVKK